MPPEQGGLPTYRLGQGPRPFMQQVQDGLSRLRPPASRPMWAAAPGWQPLLQAPCSGQQLAMQQQAHQQQQMQHHAQAMQAQHLQAQWSAQQQQAQLADAQQQHQQEQ
jgi:hypothetical protein